MHLFSRARMPEPKLPRVQALPVDEGFMTGAERSPVTPVERVTEERVTDGRQVYPDLMRSPRLQLTPDKRKTIEPFRHRYMSYRVAHANTVAYPRAVYRHFLGGRSDFCRSADRP